MASAQKQKTYDRTLTEVVEATGFSRSAFACWIRKGELPARHDNRQYLLNMDEVNAFVANRTHRKRFLSINST